MDNTKEEPLRYYEKIPEMITHSITMDEPNQKIIISSGEFILRHNEGMVTVNGEIYFDWFPSKKVYFSGDVINSQLDIMSLIGEIGESELILNDLFFSKCQISSATIGKGAFLEGFMINDSVLGDKTIPVSSVRFVIPNLKDFYGDIIKKIKDGGIQSTRSRLIFENDDWKITIDGLPNHSQLKEKVKGKGGYIIQYTGEISRDDKQIHFEEIKSTLAGFSCFLSFVNGLRCATQFHQGMHNGTILWTDYTPHKSDQFKSVYSWSVWKDISGLNEIWKNFSILWSNENDRDFIDSAIHWYLEANKNAGYLEGSLIMIQVGLELLYNWVVVEKKKLLLGKDADNISASNKIRLLLSQLKLNTNVPDELSALNQFIIVNKLDDGVEAFVQIRNAIVHAQEEKRLKLLLIDQQVKIEVLELGLWYLELCILYVLNYKGVYQSRCAGRPISSKNELNVPWTNCEL
jgi:hypothetical protein